MSAFSIVAATCGGGSNVWLLVPSGTMPTTWARSPTMFAAMLVIGATVVTITMPVPPPGDSSVEAPEPHADSSRALPSARMARGRREVREVTRGA